MILITTVGKVGAEAARLLAHLRAVRHRPCRSLLVKPRQAPSATGVPGVLHDDIQAVFPALARLTDAGPCPQEAR